jgi:hypothetical protein
MRVFRNIYYNLSGKVGPVIPPRLEPTQAMCIAGDTGRHLLVRLPSQVLQWPRPRPFILFVRLYHIHATAVRHPPIDTMEETYTTTAAATTPVTSTNRVQNRLDMAGRVQYMNLFQRSQRASVYSHRWARHQGLSRVSQCLRCMRGCRTSQEPNS